MFGVGSLGWGGGGWETENRPQLRGQDSGSRRGEGQGYRSAQCLQWPRPALGWSPSEGQVTSELEAEL